MTMSGGRLALHPDFGLDARREFSETARAAITRNEIAGSEVELDCSCIEVVGQIDDPVIGMLVTRRALRNDKAPESGWSTRPDQCGSSWKQPSSHISSTGEDEARDVPSSHLTVRVVDRCGERPRSGLTDVRDAHDCVPRRWWALRHRDEGHRAGPGARQG